MHSKTLHYVHALALRSRRYEQKLVTSPRSVLQKEGVSEAEIWLIEKLAPQSAFAFGLMIDEMNQLLYEEPDDGYLVN